MKKNILTVLFLAFTSFLTAQTPFAYEVIIANGEGFGGSQSNVGSYNISTQQYDVFDTIGTNSVQAVYVDDTVAFVAAETKIVSYNLNDKTKISETNYPGTSPSKHAFFSDDNYIYIGNLTSTFAPQLDSNIYAFNKNTLALEYSLPQADKECAGGLSHGDTLYIGQRTKGTVDQFPPFGVYNDTTGSIIVADALNGGFVRTIELGTAGSGISQIYNEGNFIFAVCPTSNKILKIEIGTDSIQEFTIPPFTQCVGIHDAKIYLDLNGFAGYFDMVNNSFALSAINMAGIAFGFDPVSQTSFGTETDYFSYGNLTVMDNSSADTFSIGISPEAMAIAYRPNVAPIAEDDNYEFEYDMATSVYTLDVLDNDMDDNTLHISSVDATNILGASAMISGDKIEYTRASGIATTDFFTYAVCDDFGDCDTAKVTVVLKNLTSIDDIETNFEISISPNPATNQITISSKHLIIEEIMISNVLGKNVKFSKESNINLFNFEKGIYLALIKTNKGTFTKKFIVK